MITIMGIDPSMRNTGVAFAEYIDGKMQLTSLHLVTTDKTKSKQIRMSSDTIARSRILYDFIQDLIAKNKPNLIFGETPTGSKSSSAMKSYGISCMLLASVNPPVIELNPTEVKMAALGSSGASKAQMIQWAVAKYPQANWIRRSGKITAINEHLADAVAVLEAGIRSSEFKRALAML